MSSDLRRRLAPIEAQTWARHRFLAAELARVSRKLAEGGVSHYVIKGPAVEERFYDRTGERPFADLDVVVLPPARIGDAVDLIDGASTDSEIAGKLADEGWIQSIDVTLPSGAVIDLHIDPLKLGFRSRFSSTVESRLEAMNIDGTTIRVLDPTASLVVALLHLNRNRFRHLSGFADVARILSRSDIDWDVFEELVRDDGLEVVIDSSLRAVVDDLGLEAVLANGWFSRYSAGLGLRHTVWNLAWRRSTRLRGTAGRFRMGRRTQFLMPALCRGRSVWLAGWMMRRLFPPSALLEFNHPSATGPYLVRLVRGRWHQILHNRFHRRDRPNGNGHLVDGAPTRSSG
ncbi:MAG: nucleotidyltransferase family protein [Actinomycetota bacterium]